jgi:hypothetical protein
MSGEKTLAEQLDEATKAKERWQIEADKLRPAFEKAQNEVRFWDRRATDLWRQMMAITFARS